MLYLRNLTFPMKLFFAVVALLLCYSSIIAQDFDGNDLHDFQLSILKADSVKSFQVYKYDIRKKGSKIDSTLIAQVIFSFGIPGSMSEHVEIAGKKPTFSSDYTCVYNDKKQVIKRIFKNSDDKETVKTYEYEYTPQGNLLAIASYDRDTLSLFITERAYNDQGKWAAKFIRTGRKQIVSRPLLTDSLLYDDNGRLGIRKEYLSDGTVNALFYYEYDGPANREMTTVTRQYNDVQHVVNKTIRNQYGQVLQSLSSVFSARLSNTRKRKPYTNIFTIPMDQ
jgi:YD repeat-containing protein